MTEMKTTREALCLVLDMFPEARDALLTLFPEFKKQKRIQVATNAFFSKGSGDDPGVWGHSDECLLTHKFLLGHNFTKIIFEWEE